MNSKTRKTHEQAVRAFDRVQEALFQERQQCLQDRRFCYVAGGQWEDWTQGQFANKPRLEINKSRLAVTRIINEYKANRISIDFIPGDGSTDGNTTDALNSLFRAGVQASGTGFIDNAFTDAVTGGIGAWRLRSQYEDEYDEDNEHQLIVFEPIVDADTSVFFDLDSKRQDKSDAKCAWVVYSMDTKSYEDTYDDSPASWPKNELQTYFDWFTPNMVYLAEYYEIETETKTVHWFGGLGGDEKKVSDEDFNDPEIISELTASGYKELRNKKVKSRRVHKYIMNGNSILEDLGFVAGENIPIVITYGNRLFIDNVERVSGHIRIVKDSQRLLNMQTSKLAEISALSSIDKPIFYPSQVMGHEMRWSADNIENFPYQLINPLYDQNGQLVPQGAIGNTKAPDLPPAMAALLQLTNQDLTDLLGNQQNGEIVQGNSSGIAIELVQAKIDMQTSGYIDNLSVSMEWCGKIWLSMAKELFVEEGRKMKGLTESGEPKQVELMRPTQDKETKAFVLANDFASLPKYDVVVTVGPSSASKRAATEKGLIALLPSIQDPETQAVLSAMIMANSEGEGMAEVRPFFRNKLIQMGAIEPSDEEKTKLEAQAKAQQGQPPPPPTPEVQANTQFLQASAQSEAAKAENLKAQTLKTLGEAGQIQAETQKILAEAKRAEAQALDIAQKIDQSKTVHFMDMTDRLSASEAPEPGEQPEPVGTVETQEPNEPPEAPEQSGQQI
jgi:hypothetical protein